MKRLTKNSCILIILLLLSISKGCAPMGSDLSKTDSLSLADQWMTSRSSYIRSNIVSELERRGDADALVLCLQNALILHRSVESMPVPKAPIQPGEMVPVIDALGRMKDPDTVDAIYQARVVKDRRVDLAILRALKAFDDSKTGKVAATYLKNSDPEIRILSLEILQAKANPVYADAVASVLFDENALVRWKAIHVLGEIGDTQSVDKVSLLLSDGDESVRNAAEVVLLKLGVSASQIKLWKQKAAKVSLDDVYQTKIAYHQVVGEKQQLQEELDNQVEVKRKLEAALQDHDRKLQSKEELVRSLYEKERQVMDKLNQLELSAAQSDQYSQELGKLNAKLVSLTHEIGAAKESETASKLKAELEKTLGEKKRMEIEAHASMAHEEDLKQEISHLQNLAQTTRRDAEHAQNEVANMRNREAFLAQEIDKLRKQLNLGMEPMVLISSPENDSSINAPSTVLNIFAVDDKGIDNITVTLNNRPIHLDVKKKARGLTAASDVENRKVYITQRLNLDYGQNTINVTATDNNGIVTGESITITRTVERGKILAAVIGINDYLHGRDLQYAVNDANAIKQYLKGNLGVLEDHIYLLTDDQATKDNIQSLLGTRIKRKAAVEDTVIIFFAGHGAVETDPSNPDGDGFEKYLLPHDADLNDLYATSISMDEIRKIFQRIRSERLIFIADTCYSGATGGRTILSSKTRASLSDSFYDRVSKGKGRVIIASCSANEVSKEDATHRHGLFTYYLLEGLRGKADFDKDGLITVDEAFGYLSKTVPRASGQDQHPVKKGESEGQLIIGKTN